MIDTLQAIAEPNRLSILQLMRNAELSAGEVAGHFKEISRPAVSQHLRVLKKAGLIAERRQGTSRIYRLRPEGFESLKALLENFWDSRLEKLKTAAEKEERKKRKKS
ncbi:MAG: winged helix-turn-helix transcriptional regulator [Nitrospina sp.]|jgi:DNA-binding transcriptional ArsR family regulator|nr:winged helix-turn-helix transcriptional regulator [Nitrospina sp.]MBT3508467.1 winged helix-turn-helix transcriptional regulator [Nitrospina sp.]MBT3875243.1 winged helix-turn-helix transcriptional regulator [Nitrospina sp.]MBT4048672.1 winged helix-turn-helix transcriptional regulator [Nitrospina sp.]MBT4559100.1 winged helix-turn-helix transcriptional regulator [Nitrospina sp.]